ncbi:peptidase M28 [Ornithinimicrobium avium]|uniref:Peptidase M28 n=2 Tax=Ornithinimicrobium avium TaxID=2283195 RepID=A0A345NRW7_9MICO|nr:peptidase M28 [Ornithinimicrobium avium]
MDHLEAFQGIADAHDGNRAAGTSGYEASADYVESTLAAAGYETQRQHFSFELFRVLIGELSTGAGAVSTIVMEYSPSGTVTAPLAAPAGAQGCAAEDWEGFPDGSIALISRGNCAFSAKSLNAVPTTGISQAAGQALLTAMASGTVEADLVIETSLEEVETFNVLAETAQGRTDNVVMLGAHLDSVEDGPGINDNGSGSAAILETAVQLAGVNKLNNQVRFAWWGAEEHGLLGSWHYVEDLYANDAEELDDIATYLNFDMVASPNYVIGVYDADESTYEAPVQVPEGSAATEDGIPASGLFTGADGTKTPEEVALFGGTEGITYDPNYHAPADDIDNVSMEALEIMSKAIAHATLSLAQDTSAVNGERSAGKSGKPHPQGPLPTKEQPAA